jgi:integrator complex subunit 3
MQTRYQNWFLNKFLATPDSVTLLPYIVRFVCVSFHPSNATIGSGVVQRYSFVGWLLLMAKNQVRCQGKIGTTS